MICPHCKKPINLLSSVVIGTQEVFFTEHKGRLYVTEWDSVQVDATDYYCCGRCGGGLPWTLIVEGFPPKEESA